MKNLQTFDDYLNETYKIKRDLPDFLEYADNNIFIKDNYQSGEDVTKQWRDWLEQNKIDVK